LLKITHINIIGKNQKYISQYGFDDRHVKDTVS